MPTTAARTWHVLTWSRNTYHVGVNCHSFWQEHMSSVTSFATFKDTCMTCHSDLCLLHTVTMWDSTTISKQLAGNDMSAGHRPTPVRSLCRTQIASGVCERPSSLHCERRLHLHCSNHLVCIAHIRMVVPSSSSPESGHRDIDETVRPPCVSAGLCCRVEA